MWPVKVYWSGSHGPAAEEIVVAGRRNGHLNIPAYVAKKTQSQDVIWCVASGELCVNIG